MANLPKCKNIGQKRACICVGRCNTTVKSVRAYVKVGNFVNLTYLIKYVINSFHVGCMYVF